MNRNTVPPEYEDLFHDIPGMVTADASTSTIDTAADAADVGNQGDMATMAADGGEGAMSGEVKSQPNKKQRRGKRSNTYTDAKGEEHPLNRARDIMLAQGGHLQPAQKEGSFYCVACAEHRNRLLPVWNGIMRRKSRFAWGDPVTGMRWRNNRVLQHVLDHRVHQLALQYERDRLKKASVRDAHNAVDRCAVKMKAWRGWLDLLSKGGKALAREYLSRVVSVSGDTAVLTACAHSWPHRWMVARIAARHTLSNEQNSFSQFVPANSTMHHVTPMSYREFQSHIAEYSRLSDTVPSVESALSISLLIDGEVDHFRTENNWIMLRYVDSDGALKHKFVGGAKGEDKGAKGILQCIKSSLSSNGWDFEKIKNRIHSIAYDSTSVNTGSTGGLGALLETHLERKIAKISCTAHVTSLAFKELFTKEKGFKQLEDAEKLALAVRNHYGGKARLSRLEKVADGMNCRLAAFHAYSTVRMAAHFQSLIESIWKNLPMVLEELEEARKNIDGLTHDERAEADKLLKRLLRKRNLKHLALAHDISFLYASLSETLQIKDLLLCDIPQHRDKFLRRGERMLNGGPIEGGMEESVLNEMKKCEGKFHGHDLHLERRRREGYEVKDTYNAVRRDAINALMDKVSKRLKQNPLMEFSAMMRPLAWDMYKTVNGEEKFITHFGNSEIRKMSELMSFNTTACLKDFRTMKRWTLNNNIGKLDSFGKLSLKKFLPILVRAVKVGDVRDSSQTLSLSSCGIALLTSMVAMAPGSMAVECMISSANVIKANTRRARIQRESANDMLEISLNAPPIAETDFRFHTGWYWQKISRRVKMMNPIVYKSRAFFKHMFSEAMDTAATTLKRVKSKKYGNRFAHLDAEDEENDRRRHVDELFAEQNHDEFPSDDDR